MKKNIIFIVIILAFLAAMVVLFMNHSKTVKPIENKQNKISKQIEEIKDSSEVYRSNIAMFESEETGEKSSTNVIADMNKKCKAVQQALEKRVPEYTAFIKKYPKATDFAFDESTEYAKYLQKTLSDKEAGVPEWTISKGDLIKYGFDDALEDGGYKCYWYVVNNDKVKTIISATYNAGSGKFEDIQTRDF